MGLSCETSRATGRRLIVKGGFLKLGPCRPLLPYLCHCKPSSVIISGSSSSVRCLARAALTVRLAGSTPSVGKPGLNKSLINQGAAETSSIFIAVTARFWHSGTPAPRIIRSLRGPSQALHGSSALSLPPPSTASARPGALIPERHGSSRWRGPQKSQSPSQVYLCRGQELQFVSTTRVQEHPVFSVDFHALLMDHRVPGLVVCRAALEQPWNWKCL